MTLINYQSYKKYIPLICTHIFKLLPHATISILFSSFVLLAQPSTPTVVTPTLRGIVVTSDETNPSQYTPLVGVTLQWLGTTTGTNSEKDGTFILPYNRAWTQLVVRMIGYKSDTIFIKDYTSSVVRIELRSIATQSKEIEVVGKAHSITNADIKTERISSKQLEESACCSLAESFEKSPSVEVTFGDAATGAKQIQLLGLRGHYTQILTEAIPMIRGYGIPFGLDYIPGAFIESISISKGSASVVQGYEGITGQINIEYKKPQEDIPLFINAYINQMGRSEVNITTAHELDTNWYGMLFVHGRRFAHEQDGNKDGFIDMPLFQQLNGMYRLYFKNINEFQLLAKVLTDEYSGGTLSAHHADSDTSRIPYSVRTKTERAEFFSKYCINDVFDSPETNLGIQLSGVYQKMRSTFGDRLFDGIERTLQAKIIFNSVLNESLTMIYGLSYLHDSFTEKFGLLDLSRVENVYGAFAEGTYSGVENLVVSAGLRIDEHAFYGMFITPRFYGRYNITDYTTLRFSAGMGTRTASSITDNLSSFINARSFLIGSMTGGFNGLQPERAWNYGISLTTTTELFGNAITIDAELFRTDFLNQVVVDFDRNPQILSINNLQGISYANSALVQAQTSLVEGLDVTLSYRLMDSYTTTGEGDTRALRLRPLLSPHRVLTTFSFKPFKDDSWQLDGSILWNSGGRIPSTAENPEEFRFAETFPSYVRFNAQITRRFSTVDLYIGAENIGNFLQQNAIISATNPSSPYFDGSLLWGPLDNRTIYLGVRWRVE